MTSLITVIMRWDSMWQCVCGQLFNSSFFISYYWSIVIRLIFASCYVRDTYCLRQLMIFATFVPVNDYNFCAHFLLLLFYFICYSKVQQLQLLSQSIHAQTYYTPKHTCNSTITHKVMPTARICSEVNSNCCPMHVSVANQRARTTLSTVLVYTRYI